MLVLWQVFLFTEIPVAEVVTVGKLVEIGISQFTHLEVIFLMTYRRWMTELLQNCGRKGSETTAKGRGLLGMLFSEKVSSDFLKRECGLMGKLSFTRLSGI